MLSSLAKSIKKALIDFKIHPKYSQNSLFDKEQSEPESTQKSKSQESEKSFDPTDTTELIDHRNKLLMKLGKVLCHLEILLNRFTKMRVKKALGDFSDKKFKRLKEKIIPYIKKRRLIKKAIKRLTELIEAVAMDQDGCCELQPYTSILGLEVKGMIEDKVIDVVSELSEDSDEVVELKSKKETLREWSKQVRALKRREARERRILDGRNDFEEDEPSIAIKLEKVETEKVKVEPEKVGMAGRLRSSNYH